MGAVLAAQNRVAGAVAAATPTMVAAVELLKRNVGAGGRLVFVGAGTSGRLGLMEAAELPGTFGVPPWQVVGILAGVSGDGEDAGDGAEDDDVQGGQDIDALLLTPMDTVVALAASGSTPYTVGAGRAARRAGASLVSITTVAGTPLAALADVAIEVLVGPEAIEGSTRMAAGSAQKFVLNTLSTATMVLLGHVHDRYMVDVVPANDKLRRRAESIIATIAEVDLACASAALRDCAGEVRAAVVQVVRGLEPHQARRLARAHPTLRSALVADQAPLPPNPTVS